MDVSLDSRDENTAPDSVRFDATDGAQRIETLALMTVAPVGKPVDPLEGSNVESCAVFQEERCDQGVLQRCDVYDPAAQTWPADVPPMLERAFLYDRWRDLYNSPDGQAVDRDFNATVLPGTPEEEWSNPALLAGYLGAGDGGIWTGWATVAAVLRYSRTGTRADYERMEQQVRDLVTLFDVTGIPGYLARYHYLLLPDGAPDDPEHIIRWEGSAVLNQHDRSVPAPEAIENLPGIYIDGVVEGDGTVWKGTPMWHGRPSIDQYTGPMTALPMAWALLEDEALKDRIAHHMTCYLKRLQRIEIVNLQSNPDLVAGLIGYFTVGELHLDPEDIDLTSLDTIVGYVHRQVNTFNEDDFDTTCPDEVQREPWRVIDASSDTILGELLLLVSDMDTGADSVKATTIDHYYWPSLRGGDAMHLMHLAAIAWYVTGDEHYRSFLYDELIGSIDAIGVANTAGAFVLPKWCRSYYGEQITFGPWWAFIEMLGEGRFKTEMMEAFYSEMYEKLGTDMGNVDLDIMVAGAVDPDIATGRDEALAYAMEQLPWMGGNGGLHMGNPDDPKWLRDPRRTYTTTADEIMAAVPPGIVAECPTQAEVDVCGADLTILGVTLPDVSGWSADACTGGSYECVLAEGGCTPMLASAPLPVHLRNHSDYIWQRNPHELGAGAPFEGWRQFGGVDYSVPYWNARRYGFIDEGAGMVLAWKPAGECE